MAKIYHQKDLRKFRFSEPGLVYAVTKSVMDRRLSLVPDPFSPNVDSDPAKIVCDSIRWHHEKGVFDCFAYCAMPDHFHLVFKLGDEWSLQKMMKILCQYTAKLINEQNGRSGSFWNKGYYERQIRDDDELGNQIRYAAENPVNAGLVRKSEEWPWCEVYPKW